MKRFWLVLLSLGLIAAFSTSAMAVDVKFSGEFYAAGLYLDKTTLVKNNSETKYTYTAVDLYDDNPNVEVAPGVFVPYATLVGLGKAPYPIPTASALGYDAYKYWKITGSTAKYPVQNMSTAFYFQRLRLNTTFVVHPGLFVVTRADIMERAWCAPRSASMVATKDMNGVTTGWAGAPLDQLSAGTAAENENIAWDLAYLTYISPIGVFMVGYQIDGAWGTVFGDNSIPVGRAFYVLPIGPVTLGVMMGKNNDGELSKTAKNPLVSATDLDSNFYTAYVKYTWKSGEAGLLGKHIDVRSNRQSASAVIGPETVYTDSVLDSAFPGGLALTVDTHTLTKYYVVIPYVKAQLGPVALQAEFSYLWGKTQFEDLNSVIFANTVYGQDNIKYQNISFFLDATADFGVAYAGGTFAYISGDDPSSADRVEGGGTLSGGLDYNPCLILFNNDLAYWHGAITGYDSSSASGTMKNVWFFQGRAGVRPIDKLDIMASVSYANAVVKPTVAWLYNDYGWEVDLTATYKITNNLSYMLGAGYLFTGKYFKGASDLNELRNDYLLINKLTVTF